MDQHQKIKLPVFVLTDLFRSSLFDLSGPKSSPAVHLPIKTVPDAHATVESLILAVAKQEQLEQQQLDFLQAIMKACRLDTEKYAVLTNQSPHFKDHTALHNHFKQKTLILFGLEPASIGLPIHFPHFQVQTFQQVQYLSAPRLEAVEADKTLKMQLWQCLKQLFPG